MGGVGSYLRTWNLDIILEGFVMKDEHGFGFYVEYI
jgi:hypothetical protein